MSTDERYVFWVTFAYEGGGERRPRHQQILAADEAEARSAAVRFYCKRYERVTLVENTGTTETEFIAQGGRVV